MIDAVIAAVKAVAQQEILPRYMKVARQRKADGSLFTEADLATQETLSRELRKIYPGPVVGEEMTENEQVAHWREGDAGLWCMDPIDGTSNFVNGLPYFAVSVALMQHGRSVLGVVYNPVADEMFYAEKGRGAFLNRGKIADEGGCTAAMGDNRERGPEAAWSQASRRSLRQSRFLPTATSGPVPWNGATPLPDASTCICMAGKNYGTTPRAA